jgi:hypothetical protein
MLEAVKQAGDNPPAIKVQVITWLPLLTGTKASWLLHRLGSSRAGFFARRSAFQLRFSIAKYNKFTFTLAKQEQLLYNSVVTLLKRAAMPDFLRGLTTT